MPNRRDCTRFTITAFIFVLLAAAPSEESRPPCSRYEVQIVNTRTCVARCPLSCGSGLCYSDNTCACEVGYSPSISGGYLCTPDCPDGCRQAGGVCVATDLCLCPKGTVFDVTVKKCIWNPKWLDPCRGRCRYGSCSADGTCTCANAYVFNSTAVGYEQYCNPSCTKNCGPNAYCYLPDMCACIGKHSHYGVDGICRP